MEQPEIVGALNIPFADRELYEAFHEPSGEWAPYSSWKSWDWEAVQADLRLRKAKAYDVIHEIPLGDYNRYTVEQGNSIAPGGIREGDVLVLRTTDQCFFLIVKRERK